jgi:hypothetical protein
VASFYIAVTKDSTAAYSLSVVSFVCVVALYAAGVLGYKIGGNYLSLEAKVHTLEQEKEELKKAVSSLLKALYVIQDGAGRMGGAPISHQKLIEEYLEPIAHLVDKEAIEHAKTDIKRSHSNP